ncbi:MAG: glutamate racemase [Desulfobacteraceae bacterium]|nr:glutamate racemase [Desulfobacteraceae bacterium]MCF8095610.1 glutamate racemase [Desulfobacteraceae bacterium]
MIGIFDSGIGGLTVVRAVMDTLPEYDIVYFGDTARTPYGNKSGRTVIEYSLENTEFLASKGAKIIVMACNTASSVATEAVKNRFDMPIYEVISPAVDLALEKTRKDIIGVIGTRATIESGIYERKIRQKSPGAKIYSTPCPLLVPIVEEGWITKPETRMIVRKYLHPLKVRQIDTLILGCTHYPVLKNIIAHKIGNKVGIIDSSVALAGQIKQFLKDSPDIDAGLGKNGQTRFYVSDVTPQFEKTARTVIKRDIKLTQVDL